MAIVIQCPSCRTKYQLKDELAGRKVKCKKCGQDFQIPAAVPIARVEPVAEAPKPAPAPSQPAAPASNPAAGAPRAAADAPQPAASAPKAPPPVPPAPAAAAPKPAKPKGPKRRCPHCDSWLEADETFCKACGMAVHKRRRDPEEERKKEEKEAARQWIFVVGAIVGAFASAPLFFVILASFIGGWLAMLVCLLEINLIVSIGSFSLASRIFRQEPPEPGDILRIVAASSLPANIAASWIVEYFGFDNPTVEKVVGFAIGTLLASVIASLLCMFQVGMPVWPAIFVCFSYNVLAVILTVVGYLLLAVIFAGWLVTTSGTPQVESPDTPPAATAPGENESDDLSLSLPPRRRALAGTSSSASVAGGWRHAPIRRSALPGRGRAFVGWVSDPATRGLESHPTPPRPPAACGAVRDSVQCAPGRRACLQLSG